MAEGSGHIKWLKYLLLLLVATPLLSFQQPAADSLPCFRKRDDLSGWIYAQLELPQHNQGAKARQLETTINKCWRAPRTIGEKQAWLDLLTNAGYYYLQSGDILASTTIYQRTFEWARINFPTVDPAFLLEHILKPLGNNYTRLGDYDQAIYIHRVSLAVSEALEDKAAMAATYSNLANTAANRREYDFALECCRKGITLVDKRSALHGLLLSEQADVYHQLKNEVLAQRSIIQAIRILEEQPTRDMAAAHWLYMAYQQAGDINAATPAMAMKYYRLALSFPTARLPYRRREQAKLFVRLARVHFAQRHTAEALASLDSCAALLLPGKDLRKINSADVYAENTLMDLFYTLAEVHGSQQHYAAAMQYYKLTFATERQLRQEYVSAASRELSVTDIRERYAHAIATAYAAWKAGGQQQYQHDLLLFMEDSKAQLLWEQLHLLNRNVKDTLQQQIRTIEQAQAYYQKEALQQGGADSTLRQQQQQLAWKLSQLHKQAAHTTPDTSLNLTTIVKKLAPHSYIRTYFTAGDRVYSLELGHDGIRYLDCQDIPADSLRYFRRHYFDEGPQAMAGSPVQYYRHAYTIYRQLFGAHPPEAGASYCLLPDGSLAGLPVEALVTNPVYKPAVGKWPFLVKQATFSYAWSLRSWYMQQNALPQEPKFTGFFVSDQRQLGNLLGVAREKQLLQEVVQGALYDNEAASTARLKTALQQGGILHISSHAFIQQDSIAAPHIALYDNPFYLFELRKTEQHPALVVLSACRTADGRYIAGEGAESMARAFVATGTPAVVAALWNVTDAAAPVLMQHFYQALKKGDNAAMALQQAKISWLEDSKVSELHKLPYYWAALSYQGNVRPIIHQQHFSWYWWLLAGALAAVGCLYVWMRRARTNNN
ncbi:CHAT domain-containing protein [Chitinophaga jiangningensis]|uniref:CHAT domain-containing protein n=1 Tax=Chitinophaga jiangningensis TaxID=1419482 RepID=A0A1M7KUF4_9BACT|nr:CHAT domain-containing tetratricopeptide repeat protein [Chitinophaga jiangningensis]SHM68826.1 CHAT domain-containing protein [Chitinophaga jiangningensis]